MSYGRSPHYIYSSTSIDGEDVVVFHTHLSTVTIPREALAQFVARLAARGTRPDGSSELSSLVAEGVALAPDDFSNDFAVSIVGGFRRPEEAT
jgi:hypothetical protein